MCSRSGPVPRSPGLTQKLERKNWKGAFERAVHVTFPLLGDKMGSSLLLLANTKEEELFSELHLGASKQKSLLLTLLLRIF